MSAAYFSHAFLVACLSVPNMTMALAVLGPQAFLIFRYPFRFAGIFPELTSSLVRLLDTGPPMIMIQFLGLFLIVVVIMVSVPDLKVL